MNHSALFALGGFALMVVLIGAAVWLANAPLQPAPQQAHVMLSDERIPR